MSVEDRDGAWVVLEDDVVVVSHSVQRLADMSAASRITGQGPTWRTRLVWGWQGFRDVAGTVVGYIALFVVIGLIALAIVGGIRGSDGSAKSAPSFCDTHNCIPSYDEGRGYSVQCGDGEWSKSGGIQGACSGHRGVR